MSNSPGWRPSFTYYNKWVSLVGAVACIALMMFMEYITGFITLIISFGIYKLARPRPCILSRTFEIDVSPNDAHCHVVHEVQLLN